MILSKLQIQSMTESLLYSMQRGDFEEERKKMIQSEGVVLFLSHPELMKRGEETIQYLAEQHVDELIHDALNLMYQA